MRSNSKSNSAETVRHAVVAMLANAESEYKPLAPFAQLATDCACHVNTVSKAMSMLKAEGLIERKGRQYFATRGARQRAVKIARNELQFKAREYAETARAFDVPFEGMVDTLSDVMRGC